MRRFFEIDSDLLSGEYSTYWNMLMSMIRLHTREFKHFWAFSGGIKELMNVTKLSQATVFRQLSQLEKSGAIIRISTHGRKNIYFIKKKNDSVALSSISSFIKTLKEDNRDYRWLEEYLKGTLADYRLDIYL